MTNLPKRRPVKVDRGLTTSPVEGTIHGDFILEPDQFTRFICDDVTYAAGNNPDRFFLQGDSTDSKYQIIFSGPHALQGRTEYTIGDEPEDVEAQFFKKHDGNISYSPAKGALTIYDSKPDGDYTRYTASAIFKFTIFDEDNIPHPATVQAHHIEFNTRPLKKTP